MQDIVNGVRRGDPQAMDELYTENKGLLYRLSRRYTRACERDRAVDEEDLIQAGYIGLLAAARAWEPDRGGWPTIAVLYVKNAMRGALGIHDKRDRAEHGALSLDKPLADDEDSSLLNTLKDNSLPDTGEAVALDDLRRKVRAEVRNLNSRHAAGVIYAHDIDGRSYRKISEETGITKNEIRQIRNKGFDELRKSPTILTLINLEDRTRYYAHKGYRAFSSSWSSVVEDAVIWRLEQYYSGGSCEAGAQPMPECDPSGGTKTTMREFVRKGRFKRITPPPLSETKPEVQSCL